jgi:hypothetical protein
MGFRARNHVPHSRIWAGCDTTFTSARRNNTSLHRRNLRSWKISVYSLRESRSSSLALRLHPVGSLKGIAP